jgi:hypothetical protein
MGATRRDDISCAIRAAPVLLGLSTPGRPSQCSSNLPRALATSVPAGVRLLLAAERRRAAGAGHQRELRHASLVGQDQRAFVAAGKNLAVVTQKSEASAGLEVNS